MTSKLLQDIEALKKEMNCAYIACVCCELGRGIIDRAVDLTIQACEEKIKERPPESCPSSMCCACALTDIASLKEELKGKYD